MNAGVSLVDRTGYSIKAIVGKATKARLDLASHVLGSARSALSSAPAQYRSSISRSYYSMYHALRATVFFATLGDDHEKHSELPEHLPTDFPDVATWKNDLKAARLSRNRADYEPFPRNHDQLSQEATRMVQIAATLLPVVRRYLRGKGCSL